MVHTATSGWLRRDEATVLLLDVSRAVLEPGVTLIQLRSHSFPLFRSILAGQANIQARSFISARGQSSGLFCSGCPGTSCCLLTPSSCYQKAAK